jgi:hypothetical protein
VGSEERNFLKWRDNELALAYLPLFLAAGSAHDHVLVFHALRARAGMRGQVRVRDSEKEMRDERLK